MYLHIGENEVISSGDIVGIFSLKQLLRSKENQITYKNMMAQNKIKKPSEHDSKSIIILRDGTYIESLISAVTLSGRLNKINKAIQNLPKWGA